MLAMISLVPARWQSPGSRRGAAGRGTGRSPPRPVSHGRVLLQAAGAKPRAVVVREERRGRGRRGGRGAPRGLRAGAGDRGDAATRGGLRSPTSSGPSGRSDTALVARRVPWSGSRAARMNPSFRLSAERTPRRSARGRSLGAAWRPRGPGSRPRSGSGAERSAPPHRLSFVTGSRPGAGRCRPRRGSCGASRGAFAAPGGVLPARSAHEVRTIAGAIAPRVVVRSVGEVGPQERLVVLPGFRGAGHGAG